MPQNNPYTLTFGKEPTQFIERATQSQEIVSSFLDEPPTQQIYLITGIRGIGKTVFMTEVSQTIQENKDWIVIELNPEKDLLESLAAKLSSEHDLAKIFKSAKINLSFFGFGLEVDADTPPINDIETALHKMLASLKKKNKKVLIAIDEVTGTQQMKTFAAAYQIFIRQNLPVCLLMTGLYENIHALQEEKSLTFLYRAPRINLGPLNINTIARDYAKTFDLELNKALEMAKLTKGYSFAFQVLGYYFWKNQNDFETAKHLCQHYLDDYAYDKIWSELSRKDKETLYGIARSKTGKVQEVREFLKMTSNEFSPYRDRLIKAGLIAGEERGYVKLTLPFFDQYIQAHYDF